MWEYPDKVKRNKKDRNVFMWLNYRLTILTFLDTIINFPSSMQQDDIVPIFSNFPRKYIERLNLKEDSANLTSGLFEQSSTKLLLSQLCNHDSTNSIQQTNANDDHSLFAWMSSNLICYIWPAFEPFIQPFCFDFSFLRNVNSSFNNQTSYNLVSVSISNSSIFTFAFSNGLIIFCSLSEASESRPKQFTFTILPLNEHQGDTVQFLTEIEPF